MSIVPLFTQSKFPTFGSLRESLWFRILGPFLLVTSLATCSNGDSENGLFSEFVPGPMIPDNVILLEAGPDIEQRAQEALINADPGDIVEFPAGSFDFMDELSISENGVTIRGQGMDETVLSFAQQGSGAQGILATGDNFVIEDIGIEDTPGDSIKIEGSNGVTIRRVRAEWTNGPSTDNGAYGFYPVQTRNVLIEDSVVIGASDAGVYVGQSQNIIVRRNRAEFNVAGIEIENSTFADVYENEAINNTGGILVFDLPNIEVQGGEQTRVYDNIVRENNTQNFAPEGNIVGSVPAGTGIMIMANDDIEVFGNTIENNQSVGVVIVNYLIIATTDDPNYDPLPERIYIHDNIFNNNSYDPVDIAAVIEGAFAGQGEAMPDIFYDGLGTTGLLPEDQRICIRNNGDIRSGVLLPATMVDADYFDCAHASLPVVALDTPEVIENGETPLSDEQVAEICDAELEGINHPAKEVDCQRLSSYGLFADSTDPTQNPVDGTPYDLISELFTDYALKYRVVFLPDGASAAYSEQNVFDFPVGTVIAKTFTIANDLRDASAGEEIIETRLLIHRQDGWVGLPYVWNQDKTDADLSVAGATRSVSWIHTDGSARSTDYRVPDANDCKTCHGEDETIPIGPKARHLNHDFAYASGTENQLTQWLSNGILAGVPADTASIVTVPDWEDSAENLDERARAYLDINCAHCHSETGMARTSQLFLEFWRPFDISYGRCKPPVAAGAGAGTLDYDIVPGSADDSILAFRMASNELDIRMPEIGKTIIHDEAVSLIRDWIDAMPPEVCTN